MSLKKHLFLISSKKLSALIGLALASQAVNADVEVNYTNSTHYLYNFTHVPDLDQKRALLPGSGLQYCVPTASMNWAAYFAIHGAAAQLPGPGDWEDPVFYNPMTLHLTNLGELMGTDPDNGTSGSGFMSGIQQWLQPSNMYAVSQEYSNTTWSPHFQHVSTHAINGGYVITIVGWYQEFKFEPDDIQRVGGHALSLTHGVRAGGGMQIGWRDPARDEGLVFMQSPYATEYYLIEQRQKKPEGGVWNMRTMSKVLGYGSGYIDELVAIYPAFALTSIPDDPGVININSAFHFFGQANSSFQSFTTAFDTPLIDLIIHPDLSSLIYIAEAASPSAPPQIWTLIPGANESVLLDLGLGNARELMIGRLRQLYVREGTSLVCFNIDLPEPEQVVQIIPKAPVAAMTYDDDTDELILLSIEGHSLTRYPHHLDAEPVVHQIPATVPLAGRGSVAWSPMHQAAWVVSDASNSLFNLVRDPFSGELVVTEVMHEKLIAPRAVDVGNAGHVYVSSQGQILEFEMPAGAGKWQLVENPIYAGVQAGDFLHVSKNHTNYQEEIHGNETWYHVLPEEFGDSISDCSEDLDGNGIVSTSDLLILFTNWGICPDDAYCDADFDYSGVVSTADLLNLFVNWGPCP